MASNQTENEIPNPTSLPENPANSAGDHVGDNAKVVNTKTLRNRIVENAVSIGRNDKTAIDREDLGPDDIETETMDDADGEQDERVIRICEAIESGEKSENARLKRKILEMEKERASQADNYKRLKESFESYRENTDKKFDTQTRY
jgi:hypothetical protein